MRNKIAYTITRILLGLAFVFFGAMKFVPQTTPPELPKAALDFMMALGATGFMMPLVGIAELGVGILLLANLWVPFSMMIHSAVMVNIIGFNVFLSPSIMGLIFVGIPLLLQAYIMYYTWDAYKPLFQKVK